MRQTRRYRWGIMLLAIGFSVGFLFSRMSGPILSGILPPVSPAKISDGPEYSHRTPPAVADLVRIFPKLIFRQGSPKVPAIALTFDDGPDMRYTPKILDTLKRYNVKATFFVVGTQILKYPATFRRIVREGHEIGSHSFQHIKLSELPAAKVRYQLNKNLEIIRSNGGPRRVPYFRPPYGALDPAAVGVIGKLGTKIALWTIDSLDWRSLSQAQVIGNVVPHVKPGYIVLQHCASESSRENLFGSGGALPDIIRTARSKGYRFVTVSQLLSSG